MYFGPSENVTIENTRLIFRNFSGKGGNREFGVILPRETALQMKVDGWNVEQSKSLGVDAVRSDFYIRIKIGKTKAGRLPKIELSNPSGSVILQNEDELDNLNKIDVDKIDVTIFPFNWVVGERYGTSACVKTLHITTQEDISEIFEA